ncbi:hypothetical protein L6164_004346 [Bauhinia variegata]|uniref:Uncharacterized protein n=1 Tax=Bauhinia variegata TaxID=167791 RepID=A0ACB9Q455_BAUVA|nr:hypothetical protein L6164_004346 [Bauhinia variegata]
MTPPSESNREENKAKMMDGNLTRSISKSLSRSSWRMEEVFASGRYSRRGSTSVDEDEEALKWAAIEKLPTYDRLRTSILQNFNDQEPHGHGNKGQHREVDVRKLDLNERQQLIDRIFKVAEEDNEKYLRKFRNRIDKVGIRLPTVEVRFQNLTVEADCYIGSRALPTLPNVALNLLESFLGMFGISTAKRTKLTILKNASGIVKPSRMALLLGPPSSGKTTLLLALAGKLDPELRVKGDITYNGYKLNEFVPRKTSAYISQNDVHVGEMTVKETLDFSARCQGVGTRYDLLAELARREKEAGIFPEAELDLFMKATAMEGTESSLFTDYTLKILGLDICKDTIVGDDMHRGVSGGQKKRVTTGEMIVGPTKTLFMDEISTGLDTSRFFKQLLVVFLIQQMAAGMFRVISGVCRTMSIANTGGTLMLLLVFMLGGFLLPKREIPNWWVWAFWLSPLSYGFNALSVNELYAPRWMDKSSSSNASIPLGRAIMNNFDVFPEKRWYWIGAAALLGFTVLYNVLFTLALMYLNPTGKKQATISDEAASEMEAEGDSKEEPRLRRPHSNKETVLRSLSTADGNNTREVAMQRMSSRANPSERRNVDSTLEAANGVTPKRGMVLPFTPLAMSFDSVNYFVDMPAEMKEQGVTEDRLQLLREVTGAFRPGVLTALMGVSGAGKTTLMDVLAGRKTGGYIEGDIRISGFPKKQETFARVSGYCEQTDIHSPQVTVQESLIYSAFLRLPKEVSKEEKMKFVDEVMDLVELYSLKDAIVGLPGVTGLSTEQRKRLTIAVELVANPSIIFMDEPTSGLDARAAAIVMRTVRNTVDTGRTVVCTIHQPSIDIFEAFDELLLMKRGGQVIYFGPLGRNSHKIIEFYEAIPGVPKIKDKYNPATWMLEVSSIAAEVRLGIDFAEHYKSSSLHQRNKALVKELSAPPPGAQDLYFPTQYSQSPWGQFKSCLWKQWWTYWRSPDYNLVRYFFTLAAALMVGTIFWRIGKQRDSSGDLSMIIGAMYASVLFVGINNCSTVQPIVAIERTVFYRERAAGMYAALPYAIAQVVCEIPYVFFQTIYYSLLVYAMVAFEWTAAKFFWFFFVSFFSFLYFTYYGMMTVSITPNHQVAAIFAAAFYGLFNLFSGFFIPRPKIPKWWVWYYWICPVAWTVYGLIVSQYRDVTETITVPGLPGEQQIKVYLEDHYGFKPDFMGPVAAVLIAFTVFFAFMFAFCIKVVVEIPCVFAQTTYYTLLAYALGVLPVDNSKVLLVFLCDVPLLHILRNDGHFHHPKSPTGRYLSSIMLFIVQSISSLVFSSPDLRFQSGGSGCYWICPVARTVYLRINHLTVWGCGGDHH